MPSEASSKEKRTELFAASRGAAQETVWKST